MAALKKCSFCNKEFEATSKHFELEEERADLITAIKYTEGFLSAKRTHVYREMWKRSIKRYKKRLGIIEKQLEEDINGI